ncbi:hypothetical protein [Corynebacterium pilosum]|uniref:Putative trehalose synthase n=1 Tax=Corynebacterium pilosum TaxID=35756 RepID=A0A376CK60_9CORY|nr:hypothetical protein [Corynebacterium pilosum]STC68587.1 putative trehalose synthase [Corynebacterium pilosum]
MDLAKERFYGAKTEPIDEITVAASQPAGIYTWQLLDVAHGGTTDTYQVLADEHSDRDQLNTEAGAQAWWEHRADFGEVHGDFVGTRAVPMGVEQSNTNLIVDKQWVVKVFRKLEDGLNPDVELLSVIGDCPNVAGVRGWLTRDGRTLAMMQQRIVGGVDGFDLARATTDFTDHARALGEATRTVHEALADEFPTEQVSTEAIVDKLHAHLDELLPQAEALRAHEPAIRELYDAAAGAGEATIQRVHGDLHLGQTLHADRWYLIDFEGEPARPLARRVLPDHRLRDVAGMVRSFGYAAAMGGHGAEWEREMVDAYLAGADADASALLAAYIVDKAAYEVVYEANNRPDWVHIPLKAITELLQG